MKQTYWLVMRQFGHEKKLVVLLCLTVALAEAGLCSIFSLSAGYLRYFGEQAALAGEDAFRLAMRGVNDVAEMLLGLVSQFWYGGAGILGLKARDILSGDAALKNLPAFILLSGVTVLIAVHCAVSLLFNVYRRQHRHFLTSLLVGGADADFVDRFVKTEALFVWVFALPVAVPMSIAETAALRRFADVFFSGSVGAQSPVPIRGNLLYAVAAGLITLIMTLRGFRKACGGLSVKNAAQELRRHTGAFLGIRALTSDAINYRVLGLPHYIAMRNIEDRMFRYIKIFFMTTIYLSDLGCFLLLMTFVRNSASGEFSGVPGGEMIFSANEFFFYASAAVTQLIATAGTVIGMISNITSNYTEYAQLRGAGASMRVIRRCARREGVLCVIIGAAIGAFWMFMLFNLFYGIYQPITPGNGIDFTGAAKPLVIVGVFTLIHTVSVYAAVCFACRKVDRVDLLQELKELSYT